MLNTHAMIISFLKMLGFTLSQYGDLVIIHKVLFFQNKVLEVGFLIDNEVTIHNHFFNKLRYGLKKSWFHMVLVSHLTNNMKVRYVTGKVIEDELYSNFIDASAFNEREIVI